MKVDSFPHSLAACSSECVASTLRGPHQGRSCSLFADSTAEQEIKMRLAHVAKTEKRVHLRSSVFVIAIMA